MYLGRIVLDTPQRPRPPRPTQQQQRRQGQEGRTEPASRRLSSDRGKPALTRGLSIVLLLLLGSSVSRPLTATATLPFAQSGQLLASSTWPTAGGNERHNGRAAAIGPSVPQTRWRTSIPFIQGLNDNTFLRSTVIGAGPDPYLYIGGGMAGVYRLRASTGELSNTWTDYLFSVRRAPDGGPIDCSSGETWVEDVTASADHTIYFVNEGGCVWAVDATTLQLKWQRRHGFLHGPPALYPHPVFGPVLFIISPDGYVKGLRTTADPAASPPAQPGDQVLRYHFVSAGGLTRATGKVSVESVREKGFAIGSDGTLYFGWDRKVFSIDPLTYDPATGAMANRQPPITVPPLSAGPALSDDERYLYFTGIDSFIRVDRQARTVSAYIIGSTLCQTGITSCDSTSSYKTGKERWPALSQDGATIYYAASNSRLYALRHTPGAPGDWKPRWIYHAGAGDGWKDGIKSDPLIDAAGTIYVYSADGVIHAVNPDGTRKWRSGDAPFFETSGVRDDFYMGTNLAMGADGTLYVATSSAATGQDVVWALGEAGGGVRPPTTLVATPVSTARIELRWIDNASGETGYVVERRGPGESNFSDLASLPAGATSYSDLAVAANASYSYRVRATSDGGDSPPSAIATATTPPGAPANLQATPAGPRQIDLTWTNDPAGAGSIAVERRGPGETDFSAVATLDPSASSYADTSVAPERTYAYRIRAVNAGGSAASAPASATTPPAPPDGTPPAAVTTLQATSSTASTITLGWTAVGDDGLSGTAARYDLRYSTTLITADTFAGALPVAGLPAPRPAGQAEAFVLGGLQPGTIYYLALRVADEAGNWSDLSNVSSASTQAASAALVELTLTAGQMSAATTTATATGPKTMATSGAELTLDRKTWTTWSSSWGTPVETWLQADLCPAGGDCPGVTLRRIKWLIGSKDYNQKYYVEVRRTGSTTWEPLVSQPYNDRTEPGFISGVSTRQIDLELTVRSVRWRFEQGALVQGKLGSIAEIYLFH